MAERLERYVPFAHPVLWKTFKISDDGELKAQLILKPENKIIRRVPLYQLGKDHEIEVKTAMHVFGEFGSYPHINIPKYNVIRGAIGEDDNRFKPYLFIVDYINGAPLPVKKFSKKDSEKGKIILESFLSSMIDYAQDKYLHGGLYPSDQLPHQYVYGNDSRGREGIFFVDPANEQFVRVFVGFISMRIVDFETRLKTSFSESREKLEHLFEVIESKGRHKETIEKLRDFMQDPNSY